jgi:hypothetical protein
MDTGQALTRFFQRNSEKAGELTLYPHKEDEFWLWVSSWAVFLQKPSDLGFGRRLRQARAAPHWHKVEAEIGDAGTEANGQAGCCAMPRSGSWMRRARSARRWRRASPS